MATAKPKYLETEYGRYYRFIRTGTKRYAQLYHSAVRCYASSLSQLYDRWSAEKQQAFDDCWKECYENGDVNSFGVAKCGGWSFTASWITDKGINPDTGEVIPVMIYKTKDNSYALEL